MTLTKDAYLSKMQDHVSLQDSQVRCVNVVPTSQADQHEADHSPTPNAQVKYAFTFSCIWKTFS